MSNSPSIERGLLEECGLPRIDGVPARSAGRLEAVRAAAVAEFQRHGYLGGSVDEIARVSGVSKPTIYAYAESKERLFLDAVGNALISAYAGLPEVPEWHDAASATASLRVFLLAWADRLLSPGTISLRRTVIGEAERFPQLALLWARTNAVYGDRPLDIALSAMADDGLLTLPANDLPLRQLVAMGVGASQLVATFRPDEFDAAELPDVVAGAVSVFWSAYRKDAR
ncbi:AcrR family transcriptional regulator [Microbacterium resistens]|uniref:AcrR family transcriptional regulator n=1 Tax=Microbacterium resistens TaxID=156977 RepID=A0ABU1S914_9MICO|nr:TetR/AcrR family transcriptional regulator [Microbacterium resistens]MDR6866098.1 AcrR family transcriptional regulator [Microbacterium resistens]